MDNWKDSVTCRVKALMNIDPKWFSPWGHSGISAVAACNMLAIIDLLDSKDLKWGELDIVPAPGFCLTWDWYPFQDIPPGFSAGVYCYNDGTVRLSAYSLDDIYLDDALIESLDNLEDSGRVEVAIDKFINKTRELLELKKKEIEKHALRMEKK